MPEGSSLPFLTAGLPCSLQTCLGTPNMCKPISCNKSLSLCPFILPSIHPSYWSCFSG